MLATTFSTSPSVLDYIPLVSSVKAGYELFCKYVYLDDPSEIQQEHSYSYLNDVSTVRLILLLIPLVGNVIVAIWDSLDVSSLLQRMLGDSSSTKTPTNSSESEDDLEGFSPDNLTLSSSDNSNEPFDPKLLQSFFTINDYDSIQYENYDPQLIKAIKRDPSQFEQTDPQLKKDNRFLETLLSNGANILPYLTEDQQNNARIFRAAFDGNIENALDYASEQILNLPDIIKLFAINYPQTIQKASDGLQTNYTYLNELVGENREIRNFLTYDMQAYIP